jgi:glutathione synthase/RimK-type ligase-like ATP-grasp enzyme
VAACESYAAGEQDFRSNAWGRRLLEGAFVPDAAMRMAVDAARALGLEFGGADVLQGASGELALAEFNSPCFFAEHIDPDGMAIAGMMIDYLAAKARRGNGYRLLSTQAR